MSEVQARPDLLKWAMVSAAVVGVAAVLYVIGAASIKPKQRPDLSDLRRGELAELVIPKAPLPGPDTPFKDASGKAVTLADFKGEVVVLNLWATWCGPCVTEMPTLAKLQAVYATQPVRVIPLSVDRDTDADLAASFIAKHPPLKLYRDASYKVAFSMQPRAEGFPTTVIYDRKGIERARLSGDADWSSPEARALIERLLAER